LASRLRLAKPLVVLDEAFDAELGHALVSHGADDYLPAHPLTAEHLQFILEKAVLRHGQRFHASERSNSRARQPDPQALDVPDVDSLAPDPTGREMLSRLTGQQQKVLRLFVQEPNEARIARQLGIQRQSVYNHLNRIQHKLHVAGHAELMKFVLQAWGSGG